ncbi:hypothetical protein AGMMS50262_22020 [Bacteroidia bacterium]|nr:hypothetical protein AGMMS50262_22020 [Bacteroidia bacterium]
MEKTIKLFFVLSFLAISSLSFAQVKVDSSGNVFFGKTLNTTGGFYFTDLMTSTSVVPFIIKRDASNNVVFCRSTGSTVNSLLFYPNGGPIAIGGEMPSTNSGGYGVPLKIYPRTAHEGGIELTMKSGNLFGYLCNISDDTGYSFWSKRAGSSSYSFYVTGTGQVYSNGSLLTSDISLKKNIETIANPLEKVLQLRGVTFQMNYVETEEKKDPEAKDAYKLAKERTPEITPEIFAQIQKEKERKQMGVIVKK